MSSSIWISTVRKDIGLLSSYSSWQRYLRFGWIIFRILHKSDLRRERCTVKLERFRRDRDNIVILKVRVEMDSFYENRRELSWHTYSSVLMYSYIWRSRQWSIARHIFDLISFIWRFRDLRFGRDIAAIACWIPSEFSKFDGSLTKDLLDIINTIISCSTLDIQGARWFRFYVVTFQWTGQDKKRRSSQERTLRPKLDQEVIISRVQLNDVDVSVRKDSYSTSESEEDILIHETRDHDSRRISRWYW